MKLYMVRTFHGDPDYQLQERERWFPTRAKAIEYANKHRLAPDCAGDVFAFEVEDSIPRRELLCVLLNRGPEAREVITATKLFSWNENTLTCRTDIRPARPASDAGDMGGGG